MSRKTKASLAGSVITGTAALGAYMTLVRPWHLQWGATDEEIARAMPLDDKVAHPTYVTNRAVTIRATPDEIWPWLVQMGESPRAGFYSYAWIERLQGMRISNANRVLDDFQKVDVGQFLDRACNMQVQFVVPNQCLVLGPPDGLPGLESTWALALYPIDGISTRLVARVRARAKPASLTQRLLLLAMDPGHFIMERKMLLEIKRRVEAARTANRVLPVEPKLAPAGAPEAQSAAIQDVEEIAEAAVTTDIEEIDEVAEIEC